MRKHTFTMGPIPVYEQGEPQRMGTGNSRTRNTFSGWHYVRQASADRAFYPRRAPYHSHRFGLTARFRRYSPKLTARWTPGRLI